MMGMQMQRRFSEMPKKMEKRISVTEEQKNVFIREWRASLESDDTFTEKEEEF